MKYREILLEQLKFQPYFDKKAIYQLSDQYGLKSATVDAYISRSLKRREIISLKKGLYISDDYYNKNKGDISYSFYIANILRTPSYVSSWTALQYYNLATEVIRTITSITPKVTRSYETRVGSFSYQSIQKDLFSDFYQVKGKFNFFIASPAKALFDLLYFKTSQFRGISFDSVKMLISELRIDIDEMNQKERIKFYMMVRKYIDHDE